MRAARGADSDIAHRPPILSLDMGFVQCREKEQSEASTKISVNSWLKTIASDCVTHRSTQDHIRAKPPRANHPLDSETERAKVDERMGHQATSLEYDEV